MSFESTKQTQVFSHKSALISQCTASLKELQCSSLFTGEKVRNKSLGFCTSSFKSCLSDIKIRNSPVPIFGNEG